MALFRVKVKTINPKKKMHVNNNKKYIFKFLQKYKKFSCFVVILYTIGINNNKNCNCMQNLLFSRKCNASIDN